MRKDPQQVCCYLKILFSYYLAKKLLKNLVWMFIHHFSKFDKFSLKIGGEIICQSWLLLTPFFNLTIVHWWPVSGVWSCLSRTWRLPLLSIRRPTTYTCHVADHKDEETDDVNLDAEGEDEKIRWHEDSLIIQTILKN